MFDFAWSELAVIGVVALVVIGPKDLPKALRTAGTLVRKARMMAREFQTSVGDMIREAELEEIRKTARELSPTSLSQRVEKHIDPAGALKESLSKGPLEAGTPAPPAISPIVPPAAPPVPPAAPPAP